MKLVAVGGGSGGHVTPVLAVLNELAKHDPSLRVVFVCDAAFESQARGIMSHADVPVDVKVIAAGKLRRYKDMTILQHMLDADIVKGNLLDLGRIVKGFTQSLRLLRREKPDAVFAKGGYVCLPLGIAAKILGIPLVIHDSDARPGLTNKVLSRYAARIATGTPTENYPYPTKITTYTGVPVTPGLKPLSDEEKLAVRESFGVIDLTKPLVVATGGGLGARSINDAMIAVASSLVQKGFSVYHVAGKSNFDDVEKKSLQHPAYQVVPFVFKDMSLLLGAADVVVTRASATSLQELAVLARPAIIVPAQHLGDQLKNAAVFKEAQAGIVLTDDDLKNRPELFEHAITMLIENQGAARALSANIAKFARPEAARDVARLVLEAAREERGDDEI